jgi:hypothetical protein
MNIQEQRILTGSAYGDNNCPDDDHNDQSNGATCDHFSTLIYALPVRTGLAEKALVGRHNEYRCVNRT